jgi:hypothetical protein
MSREEGPTNVIESEVVLTVVLDDDVGVVVRR